MVPTEPTEAVATTGADVTTSAVATTDATPPTEADALVSPTSVSEVDTTTTADTTGPDTTAVVEPTAAIAAVAGQPPSTAPVVTATTAEHVVSVGWATTGTGLAEFVVEYRYGSGSWATQMVSGHLGYHHWIQLGEHHVLPGTLVSVRVAERNAFGTGPWSNTATASFPSPPDSDGTYVAGRVVTTTGDPIPNASITLQGAEWTLGRSGPNGEFAFPVRGGWAVAIWVEHPDHQGRYYSPVPGWSPRDRFLFTPTVGEVTTDLTVVLADARLPSAVRGLAADVSPVNWVSSGEVGLRWSAPADSGGQTSLTYEIDASSDGGLTWDVLETTHQTISTWIRIGGLDDGIDYVLRVRARNAKGAGPWTTVSARPRLSAPPAPLAFEVRDPQDLGTGGLGSVEVQLYRPDQTFSPAIESAVVEYSGDGGATWTVRTLPEGQVGGSIDGIARGRPHLFRAAFTNAVGVGAYSDVVEVSILRVAFAPRLVATRAASGSVRLNWTQPADGGRPIYGYVVDVLSADGTRWERLRASGSWFTTAATTMLVGNLVDGRTYSFRVSALTGAGEGSRSAVVAIAPASAASAPSGLAVNAGPTATVLTWNPSVVGLPTNYIVQRSSDGWAWVDLASSGGATRLSLPAATGATYYRVVPGNAAGRGDPSAAVFVFAARPNAPRAFVVVPAASGQARLVWDPPAAGGAAWTHFGVQQSSDGINWTTIAGVTSTTYTATGLLDGQRYHFRVFALNAFGPTLAPAATVVPSGVPNAPWGLQIRGYGNDGGHFGWWAPTRGSAVTAYTVQISFDRSTWHTLGDTRATDVYIGDLVPGDWFYLRVYARNQYGIGPVTAPIYFPGPMA